MRKVTKARDRREHLSDERMRAAGFATLAELTKVYEPPMPVPDPRAALQAGPPHAEPSASVALQPDGSWQSPELRELTASMRVSELADPATNYALDLIMRLGRREDPDAWMALDLLTAAIGFIAKATSDDAERARIRSLHDVLRGGQGGDTRGVAWAAMCAAVESESSAQARDLANNPDRGPAVERMHAFLLCARLASVGGAAFYLGGASSDATEKDPRLDQVVRLLRQHVAGKIATTGVVAELALAAHRRAPHLFALKGLSADTTRAKLQRTIDNALKRHGHGGAPTRLLFAHAVESQQASRAK